MCKYCEDKEDVTEHIISGYVAEDRNDNITMSAFLFQNEIIFSANYLTVKASINFCPMCGRDLHKKQVKLFEKMDLMKKIKNKETIYANHKI